MSGIITLADAVALWNDPRRWAQLPKASSFKGWLTGVGSRKTDPLVCQAIRIFAAIMYSRGYRWRSGHAEGADLAFEMGVIEHPHYAVRYPPEPEEMQVILPWDGFEPYRGYGRATRARGFTEEAGYFRAPELALWEEAKSLAIETHPLGERLREEKYQAVWSLHARNMFQPLGLGLKEPSLRTYLWAPPTKDGLCTGGTRSAMALSIKLGIPAVNFAVPAHLERLIEFLRAESERFPL